MRRFAVIIHRCAGLFLAGFLTVAGLTGSVIAFHLELDRWLNPGVLTVKDPGESQLPVAAWINAVETAYPSASVTFVTVPQADDEPAALYLTQRPSLENGRPQEVPGNVDQVFVHPGTGEILGARDRDGFRFDRLHALPFVYTLHYSLHGGQWGVWLFGIVALVWFFDCFIGLYLGWPRSAWTAIRQAFTVKWDAGGPRIRYDLHRAGGLWFWIVLAALAFSGMSMNLHQEMFEPLLRAFAPQSPPAGESLPDREDPLAPLPLPLEQAINTAQIALQAKGLQGQLGAVWLDPLKGTFHFGFHTRSDLMREHPGTWVTVAPDGTAIDVRPPGGRTLGDSIHDWQFPLHSGKAFGLAGQIAISITGLAVAMLSVTGVMIWWRKMKGWRKNDGQRGADTLP